MTRNLTSIGPQPDASFCGRELSPEQSKQTEYWMSVTANLIVLYATDGSELANVRRAKQRGKWVWKTPTAKGRVDSLEEAMAHATLAFESAPPIPSRMPETQ